MAKRLSRGKGKHIVFLPDHLDQVTAIAARGATDAEMAAIFGIPAKNITAWKEFYPSFREAIEKGRTGADANVVRALYQNATGFNYEEDIVVPGGRGKTPSVLTVRKFNRPDTQAQKYWLNNRQPEHWGEKHQLGGDRSPGAKPVGLSSESKIDLIKSILSLIKSKPDGETRNA